MEKNLKNCYMTSRHFGLIFRAIGVGLNFLLIFYIGEKFRNDFSSDFFQFYSLLMLIAVISKLGFDDIVTKISVNDYKKNNSSFLRYLFKNSYKYFLLNLIISIFFFLVLKIQFNFITLLFFTFLYNINIIAFSYLNGINKLVQASLPLFIISPLIIFGCIYFLECTSWIDLVNIYVFSFLISFCFYLVLLFLVFTNSSNISYSHDIKKNIIPIATSSISGGIGIFFSIYILGFRLSSGDLILWTYSVRLVQLLSVVILLFNTYYGPIFRELFLKNDFKLIKKQFNKQIKYSILLLLPYLLLVPVFYNFFGFNNYSQTVSFESLFTCLVVGYGISMIFGSIGSLSIMLDKQNINGILGFSFSIILIGLFYFVNTDNIFFYAITLSFCVGFPKIILFLYLKFYYKL